MENTNTKGINGDKMLCRLNSLSNCTLPVGLPKLRPSYVHKLVRRHPKKEMDSSSSSSVSLSMHQMQVRVTFYTDDNPQSVLMIINAETALEQIAEKARSLFPDARYRVYYGDVNGPIYEFTDSKQIMSKVRISSFSRTPQLFVRLEKVESLPVPKKVRSSKRESLRKIQEIQEDTLKSVDQLKREFGRISELEKTVSELKEMSLKAEEPNNKKKKVQQSKHSATCDACLGDIIGHRYKCLECPDFDLCENCEKKSVHYEHAMLRIVCPQKTKIPNYIVKNAPNSVFPSYMRNSTQSDNVIEIDIPLDIPLPKTDSKENDAAVKRMLQEDARNALLASANLIKGAFQTMGSGFLDMAAGADKFKDKMAPPSVDPRHAVLSKALAERRFRTAAESAEISAAMDAAATNPAAAEAVGDFHAQFESRKTARNIYKQAATNLAPTKRGLLKDAEASERLDAYINGTKANNIYKKAAANLVCSNSILASMTKEETERRTDACAADLRQKLAELGLQEHANMVPRSERLPEGVSLETPASWAVFLGAPREDSKPVTSEPELLAERVIPLPEQPVAQTKPTTVDVPVQTTRTVLSTHSSFENISPEFDMTYRPISESSDDWEAPERIEYDSEDDVDDYNPSQPTATPAETDAPAPAEPTAPQQSTVTNDTLIGVDAKTENTFDRLLEMGFDYNVVVAAIKSNGSEVEDCLAALLR